MPSRLGKHAQDINVWDAVHNDAHRPLRKINNIEVVLNANNPPTVKAGTSFYFAKDGSFTSSATGSLNNVYPANSALAYTEDDVIFEILDRTFAWGAGLFPTLTISTIYYLYCTGAEDIDINSRGKGIYGASTNVPTYDNQKGGWYNTEGFVLATFKTDAGGNVGNLEIYGNDIPAGTDGNSVIIQKGKLIESVNNTSIVYDTTLPYSTTTVSIIGLDLATDGEYELNVLFYPSAATLFALYFNGDTSGTNYYQNRNIISNGVNLPSLMSNDARIITNDTNKPFQFFAKITQMKTTTANQYYPIAYFDNFRIRTSSTTDFYEFGHVMKRVNTANITQISIVSSSANQIAAGTRIILTRKI